MQQNKAISQKSTIINQKKNEKANFNKIKQLRYQNRKEFKINKLFPKFKNLRISLMTY